jgi:hypothetical protein
MLDTYQNMAHGGKRLGAGRKKGLAARDAEEARRRFAELVRKEVVPIAEALISRAKKGEVAAARELFDRAWGRPHQSADIATQQSVTIHLDETIAAKNLIYRGTQDEPLCL